MKSNAGGTPVARAGTLGPERRLIEEHLEICAACTREFTFEASVLTGVRRKLRQLSVPPDLLARIAAEIRAAGEGDPG